MADRRVGYASIFSICFAGGDSSRALDSRVPLYSSSVRSLARTGVNFPAARYTTGPRDAILGSPLSIQVASGDRFVKISYTTGPCATGLQWLEPAQTATGRSPFLFTQSQEIHARSWIPLQDTPSVRLTFRLGFGPRTACGR